MGLNRPPTYAKVLNSDDSTREPWLQYWGGLQSEIETPALIALLGALFRRGRRSLTVVQTAWANRGSYSASTYPPGSLLVITDHPLIFVSNAGTWKYKAGRFVETYANIPTAALNANDAGLLFDVTDYSHVLHWGGASWGARWGFGNPEDSGGYSLRETAPQGYGANAWQICNGAAVARLNPDGTTTNVTVPDVTTARYLVGGLAAAAVAAATTHTHPVDPPSTTSGNNSASQEVASGVGVTVAAHPHTHATDVASFNSGTNTAFDLERKQGILYYRR
jgi:hypothetical protein